MDTLLTDDLKKQYDALPKELQGAILAADLPRKLETITKSNKLMVDQAGGLQTETFLVLLGLESLAGYVDNLVKNVGLSKDQAIAVANDANELIFKDIRESLKKINEEAEVADKNTEGSAAPALGMPSREEILSGIEKPEETKNNLLPMVENKSYHENISPVADIVKAKMTETVIVPKETVEIKLESKLPEKSKPSSGEDPYREPII